MIEQFWMNADEEVVVNASDEVKDCAHCPCSSVCVGEVNRGYTARCYFTWNGVVEGPVQFNLLWDQLGFGTDESARNTWSGTGGCGSPFEGFNLRVYCRDDFWFFDLFLADFGPNYGTPISNVPGGATLVGTGPLHVRGEITSGFYAQDFPFCSRTSSAPAGDFLNDFHFDMTEF